LPRVVVASGRSHPQCARDLCAAGEVDEWEAELPFTAEQQKEFLSQYWQKRPLLVRGAAPSVVVSTPTPRQRALLSGRC